MKGSESVVREEFPQGRRRRVAGSGGDGSDRFSLFIEGGLTCRLLFVTG